MRIVMNRRARLGIKVNLQARATDSLGAYVESVTPNGPAAEGRAPLGRPHHQAGRQVGAERRAAPTSRDARQSLPGLRLIELAARLEPNDTVPVEFLRGKDRRTVSLVTEDEPDMFMAGPGGGHRPFVMRFRGDGPHDDVRLQVGDFMDMGPGERFEFLAGSPLGDLELAPLNPDLGQYFGTTEGVLVIRAPQGRHPRPQGRRRSPGGGRPEAGRPVPPDAHPAELRSGRNLQAGHPAEPEAGDGDRPPRRARRLMCAASQMSGTERRYMFGPPWRAL